MISVFPNADETLKNKAYEKAHKLYGHKLPAIVQNRLDEELKIIIQQGYSSLFLISQKIAQQSHNDDFPICYHGMIGSSLIAYLTEITSVNPLSPHWRCPKCHHSEFVTDGTYASGFDLPNHDCQNCDEPMIKDGHDIPYAVLFGRDGNKKPNIAIAFSDHEQPFIRKYIEQFLGKDNVSNGITETSPYEDTQSYIQVHLGDLTIDILKENELDLLKKLEDNTHCSLLDISFDDASTLSLFRSAESLGIMDEAWEIETGTLGIREFAASEVRQILSKTKPNCFSELVKVYALSYGAGTWEGNAEELIRDGVCTISNVTASRDDVIMYLIRRGIKPLDAFKIMETVRRGKGIDQDTAEMLKAHGIPDWYINSCRKIRYLCPRAHGVSCVIVAYQLAYYKARYPVDFYCAYFAIHADDSDMMIIKAGKEAVQDELKKLDILNELDEKYDKRRAVLQLALEMYMCGYTLKDL